LRFYVENRYAQWKTKSEVIQHAGRSENCNPRFHCRAYTTKKNYGRQEQTLTSTLRDSSAGNEQRAGPQLVAGSSAPARQGPPPSGSPGSPQSSPVCWRSWHGGTTDLPGWQVMTDKGSQIGPCRALLEDV